LQYVKEGQDFPAICPSGIRCTVMDPFPLKSECVPEPHQEQ
jgi:hypothetical protein